MGNESRDGNGLVYIVMVRARGESTAGFAAASCTSERVAQDFRQALDGLRPSHPLHFALQRTYVVPVPFEGGREDA